MRLVSGMIGIAAVVLSSSSLAYASETVQLAPKWTVGQTDRYEFVFRSTRISGNADGSETGTQVISNTGRLVRQVIATSNAGTTLALSYEQVASIIGAADASDSSKITPKLSFDSAADKPAEGSEDFGKAMRFAINLPITIKLDAKGEIIAIEGNQLPPVKRDDPKPMNYTPANSLVGDQILRRLLAPLYRLEGAPEQASIGTKWTTSEDTSQPPVGILTAKKTHTLTNVENGVATITTTGDVKLAPSVGNSAVKSSLTGARIDGQTEWDSLAGTLRTSRIEQNVVIQGEDAAGRNRKLDSTVLVSLRRIEPAPTAKPPEKKDDSPRE